MSRKDYYYMRSGFIHKVHAVDSAMQLSRNEVVRLMDELEESPSDKQEILKKNWAFYEYTVGRKKIDDFKAYLDALCEKKRKEDLNGWKTEERK